MLEEHYASKIFSIFCKKENQSKSSEELNKMLLHQLKEYKEIIELENTNRVVSTINKEVNELIQSKLL